MKIDVTTTGVGSRIIRKGFKQFSDEYEEEYSVYDVGVVVRLYEFATATQARQVADEAAKQIREVLTGNQIQWHERDN